MARAYWQTERDGLTHYVQITPDEVITGRHARSGETDEGGGCSHEEFLAGRDHDIVRDALGEEVLQQVLSEVHAYRR